MTSNARVKHSEQIIMASYTQITIVSGYILHANSHLPGRLWMQEWRDSTSLYNGITCTWLQITNTVQYMCLAGQCRGTSCKRCSSCNLPHVFSLQMCCTAGCTNTARHQLMVHPSCEVNTHAMMTSSESFKDNLPNPPAGPEGAKNSASQNMHSLNGCSQNEAGVRVQV